MKKVVDFIKVTALGGLLVIIPVSIVVFVLVQLYISIVGFVRSLVDALPIDLRNDATLIFLLTVATLVAVCFLTGLLVQTRLGIAMQRWAKRNIADRIPMYNALTSLTRRVAGIEGREFGPVEVDLFGSDTRSLGFLIEALPENRCAVFVPSAPLVTAGQLYILPATKVHAIDASMSDAMTVVTQWGVDARALYGNSSDEEHREIS